MLRSLSIPAGRCKIESLSGRIRGFVEHQSARPIISLRSNCRWQRCFTKTLYNGQGAIKRMRYRSRAAFSGDDDPLLSIGGILAGLLVNRVLVTLRSGLVVRLSGRGENILGESQPRMGGERQPRNTKHQREAIQQSRSPLRSRDGKRSLMAWASSSGRSRPSWPVGRPRRPCLSGHPSLLQRRR